mgnify:CR=1 FL=1
MFNLFSKDIGIDLGTASVLVYIKGKGVVLREPSVVAMDKNTGKLLKVGTDAQAMLGRTPGNIVAMRPLREGVISDYDMTERMLKEFIKKVTTFSLFKPRLLICVPSGITEVEERAVVDAGIQAGRALIVDEHMRTSAPGIYAAGDCCEAVDIQTRTPKNIGVWMNAQRQGAVAGANMVGVPEKFGANLLLNLAHYMDYDFVSIGDITTCTPEDEAYEYEDDHYYILAKKRRGRITCINMIGTADSNGVVKQILTRAFETGSTGLDIKTACFLIDKGFPKGFIDFIGGITID